MSDIEDRANSPESDPEQEMETLPHGRYIPYSGGSMGWFENQGVLKSERGNRYRFFDEMGSEYVRATLFQRWGQVTDKRSARRMARENSVNVLMSDESVPETPFQIQTPGGVLSGTTKDISHYGMRMQFSQPPELKRGAKVTLQLMDRTGSEPLLELAAQVVWIKREMVVRPVWFVGVAFQELTADTEQFFHEFLGR